MDAAVDDAVIVGNEARSPAPGPFKFDADGVSANAAGAPAEHRQN